MKPSTYLVKVSQRVLHLLQVTSPAPITEPTSEQLCKHNRFPCDKRAKSCANWQTKVVPRKQQRFRPS